MYYIFQIKFVYHINHIKYLLVIIEVLKHLMLYSTLIYESYQLCNNMTSLGLVMFRELLHRECSSA